ncbi:hypothetical protein H8E52_05985 [bacterium]|nr:hypothetical protein [bacterium]
MTLTFRLILLYSSSTEGVGETHWRLDSDGETTWRDISWAIKLAQRICGIITKSVETVDISATSTTSVKGTAIQGWTAQGHHGAVINGSIAIFIVGQVDDKVSYPGLLDVQFENHIGDGSTASDM